MRGVMRTSQGRTAREVSTTGAFIGIAVWEAISWMSFAITGREFELLDGGKAKKTIKVSVMKTTDTAPFHLAREKGLFKKEGLDVKYVDAKSGGDSLNKLISGEADIAYSGYVPALLLENKGAAKSKGGMKIVADASSAGPGSTIVMATPSSPVKSVKDMAGKKVAVNEIGGMSDLLVKSALKTNGVSYKKVKWVSTPFPAVAQTLKSKNVDAAFATEPFIQAAMKKASAKQVCLCKLPPSVSLWVLISGRCDFSELPASSEP